jgi:Kef-type K+ transport system membrane component KefB
MPPKRNRFDAGLTSRDFPIGRARFGRSFSGKQRDIPPCRGLGGCARIAERRTHATVTFSKVTLVLLLLQTAGILAICRLLHGIAGRFGQPPVIGEIVAGLLLGPSFFGWIAPALYARLFPAASLPVLNELSQIGLILFMFLVGLHLGLTEVYALRRVAGLASLLSNLVPFVLGLALARPLHVLAPSSPMLPFSLLIAVAISITAFPVLARILADQKLSATKLGHVAIACAALNDVVAWSFLAWIAAISRSGEASALGTFVILPMYIFSMFAVIRSALRWFAGRLTAANELSTMLIFVFLSSWVTELVGFHALFGAFLAGVIWPRSHSNRDDVAAKIEPLTMTMLIPLFFSFTGLRTNIGALGGNLGLTALVIAVAIAAKVGGAFTGAKIAGFNVRNSLALGCLLNTRGLVELITASIFDDGDHGVGDNRNYDSRVKGRAAGGVSAHRFECVLEFRTH